MNTIEAIEKFKLEHDIPYDTQDIVDYVMDKARDLIKGQSGFIDDETVYGWILKYNPDQEELERLEEKKQKEKEKAEALLAKQKAEEKKMFDERRQEEIERTGMVPLF